MGLVLTQPLTEMSTGNIFWGLKADCVGLTTLPTVLKYDSLNPLESSGPVQASNGKSLPLPLPLSILPGLFNYTFNSSDYSVIILSSNYRLPRTVGSRIVLTQPAGAAQ